VASWRAGCSIASSIRSSAFQFIARNRPRLVGPGRAGPGRASVGRPSPAVAAVRYRSAPDDQKFHQARRKWQLAGRARRRRNDVSRAQRELLWVVGGNRVDRELLAVSYSRYANTRILCSDYGYMSPFSIRIQGNSEKYTATRKWQYLRFAWNFLQEISLLCLGQNYTYACCFVLNSLNLLNLRQNYADANENDDVTYQKNILYQCRNVAWVQPANEDYRHQKYVLLSNRMFKMSAFSVDICRESFAKYQNRLAYCFISQISPDSLRSRYRIRYVLWFWLLTETYWNYALLFCFARKHHTNGNQNKTNLLFNCEIRSLCLRLRHIGVSEINTAPNNTVKHSFVLNERAKFGKKMFRYFWDIVIFVLGYFSESPCVWPAMVIDIPFLFVQPFHSLRFPFPINSIPRFQRAIPKKSRENALNH